MGQTELVTREERMAIIQDLLIRGELNMRRFTSEEVEVCIDRELGYPVVITRAYEDAQQIGRVGVLMSLPHGIIIPNPKEGGSRLHNLGGNSSKSKGWNFSQHSFDRITYKQYITKLKEEES